ncbi:hypothetical protein TKK_0003898 [Trichogramma kaykai]
MSQLNKLGVSKLWPKLSKVENVIGEHREEMKKCSETIEVLQLRYAKRIPSALSGYRIWHVYQTIKIHAIMLRGFFQHWALDSFMKLVRDQLSIEVCEMIIDDSFTNQNFYNICVAAKLQSDEDSRKNAMTNAEGPAAPKRLKLE